MLSIDDDETLLRAVEHWRAGDLVAFPTETVYGLGGDAENDRAVAAIFAAKGRPSFNPLILHVGDVALAERYADVSAEAARLMARCWPGPLTLVLPRRADSPASLLASAGLNSVALRLPGHARSRLLLQMFGRAVAAPSANRSGHVSPSEAAHVAEEFAGSRQPALIIDGGGCRIGVESTVLDLSGVTPRLLRPGAVLAEELRALLPDLVVGNDGAEEAPVAPGMLSSHYAPRLPLRLDAIAPEPGEAWLAFGLTTLRAQGSLNLSPAGEVDEAAANLFSHLRRLDLPERYRAIAVASVPESGLGVAINDRLRRAAAPRDQAKN